MKKINQIVLIFILSFFAFSASPVYATDAGCGLEYSTSGDDSTPIIVKEHNFEICESDLSFNVFYMLFGDLLQSELADDTLNLLVEVSDTTRSINSVAGLGGTILSLFQALSSIVFYIGGIWLLWQTGKYIYVTQTSGKFLGNQGGSKMAMSVAMQGMAAIFLITPVGSILMIQFILLMFSVAGISLANFFLSSFLHHTHVKTTEVEINNLDIIERGDQFSSSLVEEELCEIRTASAILNSKALKNSVYITESPDTWGVFSGDNEVDNFLEVTHSCVVKYNAMPKESSKTSNALGMVQILQQAYNSCDEEEVIAEIKRDNSAFGYKHVCGTLTYAWHDMHYLEDMGVQNEEEDGIDFINNAIDDSSYANEFSTNDFFNNFYNSDVKTNITNILNDNTKTANQKKKELNEFYFLKGEEMYESIKGKNLLDADNFSNIKNQKIRLDLIAATHINAINHLLGGYIVEDHGFEDDNDYHYYEKDKVLFGFDYIRNKGAKESANKLHQAHCAINWDGLFTNRLFYKKYEEMKASNESALELLGDPDRNFECFEFVKSISDSDYGEFKYVLDDPDVFSDIDGSIRNNTHAPIAKRMVEQVAPELKIEAKIEMEIMKGYYFATKYAILKSMSEQIKESADTSILTKTREKGWAFLGSLLLEIANSQGNARKYTDTVIETAGVFTLNNSESAMNRTFYNSYALEENPTGNPMEDSIMLNKMSIGDVFTKNKGLVISDNSATLNDEWFLIDAWEGFQMSLKRIFLSPIIYIQRGSGMDTTDSLSEGLEKCAQYNDCIPSESHPINTLMMFGQDLISQAISIIIIGHVAEMIGSMDVDSPKSGIMTKVFGNIPILKVLNIITKIAKVVAAFVNAIMPFVGTMLLVGVLCAYLLPTLPYITFAIVFLNWLISIFVVLFTSPILVLIMARLDENGNNQITLARMWQSYGSVLLKPALITIAMIFAWTLSSVSLYFINSTIYPLFMSIGSSSSGLLMDIVSTVAIYVVYISTVIIVVRHSFSIISKFGDEFLSIIGVRGAGDAGIVQSMNLERLLVASQVSQGIQQGTKSGLNLATKGAGSVRNKMRDKLKDRQNRKNFKGNK